MPAISVLIKPSSGMCNLQCDYCFYCDETEKRLQASYGFMSEETLKNVIRKTILRAEGMISYVFQGGEPTLRGLVFYKKVIEYEHQYNRHHIQVNNALQTNGYLLNDEWCQFLKDNNFLVGLSIDGIPETHNLYRHTKNGEPTYDQVLKSIDYLQKYNVDFNILTVVNQKVASSIDAIYAYYRKKGWHYQQYIACLDPLNEPHGQNPYAVTPQQYGEFLISLFRLWYKDWKNGCAPYIRQFENYIGILLGYRPESCDQCGICNIQNVVEADGSVYPCDFYVLDSYYLGNFNQDQLDDIDRRRKKTDFISRSQKLKPSCIQCQYHYICRGGCQRNRDFDSTLGLYENYFCESYRMFFDACLGDMRTVAECIRSRS